MTRNDVSVAAQEGQLERRHHLALVVEQQDGTLRQSIAGIIEAEFGAVTADRIVSPGRLLHRTPSVSRRRRSRNDGLAIPYELPVREYLQSFPTSGGLPVVPATDVRNAPFPDGGEVRITVS